MKKVKLFLVFLFMLLSSIYLHAQWARIYKQTGILRADYGYSVQETSDGGYIVAGQTSSWGAGAGDIWIIKLFSNGTIEWQRTYGGIHEDRASSIQQTSDGGYIVAGQTWTWGAGANDAWIIKLSSSGAVEWQWTYGGSDNDSAYSVQETSDGGYIVAGSTNSFGAGDSDFWVIKLASTGAVEWQRTYGGTDNDHAESIQETGDGGYIVAGCTYSFGAGSGDFWVIKLTSTGDVEWQRTYGGSDFDKAQSIGETTDGGYAVAGYTGSFGAGGYDIWILKITSAGIIEWQKTFGKEWYDMAYSIQGTDDGGCVVAGSTGSGDVWVIKLTPSGAVDWQRTFAGDEGDRAHSIQQTSDGGYIVAGYSYSSFGDALGDILVFKLDSNGDILPSCGYLGIFDTTITDTSASSSTPNIVTDDTNVAPSITIASANASHSNAYLLCGSPEYVLAISSSYGGTTNPSPGGYPYIPGAEATVHALPDFGYMFKEWSGNVPSGNKYDNPLTILMDSDKSIKANFVIITGNYELTINTASGGTTDPAPGIYSHPAGTEVCITAVPDPGNSFLYWSGDVPEGQENNNPLCITMNSNKALTPHFRFPAKPWTFMVYLDGDNSLEAASIDDFLEMAMVGSDANVNIVVQFDRTGELDSDTRYGDWTSTKRFYVSLGQAPSPENAFEDLGELNMGAPQTLAEFIYWAKASFPADNYALILWDKGGGWYGLCEDSTSSGDYLSLDELQSALSSSGGANLIGFNAALMGMVEVAYEIRSNGQVMVGSEESIPLEGWPYTAILQDLEAYPAWQASELGIAIVNRYYESHNNKQTLSAINLSNINTLVTTISTLAQTMIDSWNTDPSAVKNAAQSVMAEIENTVIYEKHGSSWPGAHGLAVYFPEISDEFSSDYNGTKLDFLADTQWEEFLQEFYSSMAGSWIAQRRAGSQQFFYPQNIDLYDFCRMLNLIQQDSYAESSTSPEWKGGGTSQDMQYVDDYNFLHTLPFDFPYFDEIIPAGTYLTICSNGFVDIGLSTDTDYTNTGYELINKKRIAPCWTDLTTAGSWWLEQDIYITEETESLTIRWKAETAEYKQPVNIELILYSNGRIQFNYGEGNSDLYHWLNGQGPTIGISKGDGTNFCFASHNVKKTLTNAETIIFSPLTNYFNLVIAESSGGTTNPSPGIHTYSQGTEVTVSAIPDTLYGFNGWTGDVPSGHEMDNPLIVTMDSRRTITATFTRTKYNLTISAVGGGTTEPAPGTYTHDKGAQVTVKAVPYTSGWVFSGWSGSVSGTTNPITIIMDADKSITANFKQASAGDGDTGDSKGGGGCFIATAAYGSPLHPHVEILRAFRDKYLGPNKPGSRLVNLYYKYSPSIAGLVVKSRSLKACVRISILPLVTFSYLMVRFGPFIAAGLAVLIFVPPAFLICLGRKRVRGRRRIK